MQTPNSRPAARATALDKRRTTQASPAAPHSRRAFLGMVALGASGLVLPSSGAATKERRWEVARQFVASGVIGRVQVASAIVPMDAGGFARSRMREHFGEVFPDKIADALTGMLSVLSRDRPIRMQTATHEGTEAFSMTCALAGGQTIAIAGASAHTRFTATFRGTRGALYVADDVVSVESAGTWRELRV